MSTDKVTRKLHEEVVIFENVAGAESGARAVAPDHSPRTSPENEVRPVVRGMVAGTQELVREVVQFLFHQSELLDAKLWKAFIELFAEDGVYWMPVNPQQTEWLDSPSIFAEDRAMMSIRMGRVSHPNAWSQAPMWGTSHIVGNIVIEAASEERIEVRSRFHMVELRRDEQRHFAGTYRHTLLRVGTELKIELQRVDLLSSQAIFDYVLQIWV